MKKRRPFLKLALRTMALTHPRQRKNIRKALRNKELMDSLGSAVVSQMGEESDDTDGLFARILKWIVENPEQFFAILTKLIALFAI